VQVVRNHDTFDHVGDHGAAGATAKPDRHDGTVGSSANRSVDTDEPRWTPEARTREAPTARLACEDSSGSGELDSGG
jgi:hypothetical protein